MRVVTLSFLLFFISSLALADSPWERSPGLDESQDPRDKVVAYETTANKAKLFHKETLEYSAPNSDARALTLTLNPSKTFQSLDGFGAAITGSTAVNLLKMPEDARRELLIETFSPTEGLGYSYVRVSIGCSDFSLSEFSLCDEPGIENFAHEPHEIAAERVIPFSNRLFGEINRLIGSRVTSGSLNPKYYDDYATYFVKYIEAMRELGVEINAITMQNEPLNRGNSASLYMTWQEQKEFVKVLGAKMRDARIKTEIIAFDHNFNYDVNKPECRDQVGYPLHIYDDPEAAQYLVGAAYHAYGGSKEELKRVRDARPDKAIYFTEQSIGEWNYSFGGDLMWFMREIHARRSKGSLSSRRMR